MFCLPSLSYLQGKMLGSSRSCLKAGAIYSLFPQTSDVENKLMHTKSHGDGTSDRVWIEAEAAKKVKYYHPNLGLAFRLRQYELH